MVRSTVCGRFSLPVLAIVLGIGPAQRASAQTLTASMTIGHVAPTLTKPPARTLIEHETMLDVPVTFQLKPFVGGARSGPVDAFVCAAGASGECLADVYGTLGTSVGRRFAGLTSDKAVSAVLRIAAPTAGAHARLRLNLCVTPPSGDINNCSQLLAIAESEELRVAARYQVDFRDINALAIRSPHSDTLYYAVQAGRRGAAPSCAANSCKQGSPDRSHSPINIYQPTNAQEGNHQVVLASGLGPFVLVPDEDKELIVSYAALNFGSDYTDAQRTALTTKITSTLSAAITFIQSTTYDVMRNLRNSSNPPQWKGCDGPLAADVFVIPNSGANGLASVTAGGKPYVIGLDSPGVLHKYTNPAGGECKASVYRVTVQVARLSRSN